MIMMARPSILMDNKMIKLCKVPHNQKPLKTLVVKSLINSGFSFPCSLFTNVLVKV